MKRQATKMGVTTVLVVLLGAVAGGAACGGPPVLVMYDTALEPQLALQLNDARGEELRVHDAFALGDDLLVVGERVLGERCENGVSDSYGTLPPLPTRSCANFVHGFIARVDRGGAVRWSLGAEGAREASCPFTVLFDVAGLHLTASCADGAALAGAADVNAMVDVETGALLGAPAPPAGTIYDFVAPLDDGTTIGVMGGTVTRGTMNDGGVLEDRMWSSTVGDADGYLDPVGLHVLDGEVLVAGRSSRYEELRFAALDPDTGALLQNDVTEGANAWASARGWWSTSASLDAPELQHRDAAGALQAAVQPAGFPLVLTATFAELWVAQNDGGSPVTPVRVDVP